jgi:hypothetical protein
MNLRTEEIENPRAQEVIRFLLNQQDFPPSLDRLDAEDHHPRNDLVEPEIPERRINTGDRRPHNDQRSEREGPVTPACEWPISGGAHFALLRRAILTRAWSPVLAIPMAPFPYHRRKFPDRALARYLTEFCASSTGRRNTLPETHNVA